MTPDIPSVRVTVVLLFRYDNSSTDALGTRRDRFVTFADHLRFCLIAVFTAGHALFIR